MILSNYYNIPLFFYALSAEYWVDTLNRILEKERCFLDMPP